MAAEALAIILPVALIQEDEAQMRKCRLDGLSIVQTVVTAVRVLLDFARRLSSKTSRQCSEAFLRYLHLSEEAMRLARSTTDSREAKRAEADAQLGVAEAEEARFVAKCELQFFLEALYAEVGEASEPALRALEPIRRRTPRSSFVDPCAESERGRVLLESMVRIAETVRDANSELCAEGGFMALNFLPRRDLVAIRYAAGAAASRAVAAVQAATVVAARFSFPPLREHFERRPFVDREMAAWLHEAECVVASAEPRDPTDLAPVVHGDLVQTIFAESSRNAPVSGASNRARFAELDLPALHRVASAGAAAGAALTALCATTEQPPPTFAFVLSATVTAVTATVHGTVLQENFRRDAEQFRLPSCWETGGPPYYTLPRPTKLSFANGSEMKQELKRQDKEKQKLLDTWRDQVCQ